MRFADRTAAAEQLLPRLEKYRAAPKTLLLALPKGGIPLAASLAEELELPMDILAVAKITPPEQEEYAIGAVAEGGGQFWSQTDAQLAGLSESDLREEAELKRKHLPQVRQSITGHSESPTLNDTTVILVDDGAATGATLLAAIDGARKQGACHVVVSVPVVSEHAAELLQKSADEALMLEVPTLFTSVSTFYDDFPQVTTAEAKQAFAQAQT